MIWPLDMQFYGVIKLCFVRAILRKLYFFFSIWGCSPYWLPDYCPFRSAPARLGQLRFLSLGRPRLLEPGSVFHFGSTQVGFNVDFQH